MTSRPARILRAGVAAAAIALALTAGATTASAALTDPVLKEADAQCRVAGDHGFVHPFNAADPRPDAEGALSWLSSAGATWGRIYPELIGEKAAPKNAAALARFVTSLRSGVVNLLAVTDGIAAGTPQVVPDGKTVRLVIPPEQAKAFRAAVADHARALAAARALKLPNCIKTLRQDAPTRHAGIGTR